MAQIVLTRHTYRFINRIFGIICNGYIVLDGDQMDAYKGDTLMNRYVAGDYNNLKFKVGANTLSWTGNVTQVTVENISRWV